MLPDMIMDIDTFMRRDKPCRIISYSKKNQSFSQKMFICLNNCCLPDPASSLETLNQFQPNLAYSIYGCRGVQIVKFHGA